MLEVLVAQATSVDMDEIEQWSRREGKIEEFKSIRSRLRKKA